MTKETIKQLDSLKDRLDDLRIDISGLKDESEEAEIYDAFEEIEQKIIDAIDLINELMF